MEVILNIGLDGIPTTPSYTNGVRNPEVITAALTAVQAARNLDFAVGLVRMLRSDTEPTLVLRVTDGDQPGQDNRIDMLAAQLSQDCIAVYNPLEDFGQLIGPRAEKWGDFNPQFFFLPDGSRLAGTGLQQAA